MNYRELFDYASDLILGMDSTGKLVFANPAFHRLLGYSTDEVSRLCIPDLLDPDCLERCMGHFQGLLGGQTMPPVEATFRTRDGHAIHVEGRCSCKITNGEPPVVLGIFRDVTARRRSEELISGQLRVLEMIATGARLDQTLTELALLVERQSQGALCSILLLDADGLHLRHGAAPSLPSEYTRAIDGTEIGENVGSCGTAMFRRQTVIVADIATDPLWADYRDLALPHGLRACWSTPIFDAEQRVLGSFAIYQPKPATPDDRQRHLVEMATHIAAICIGRDRADTTLRNSREKLDFLSNFDALTGLAGRALFRDRLDQIALSARQADEHLAVMVLDLEQFKALNDVHGAAIGDALLKAVAERLIEIGGSAVYIARVGGDRFAVAVPRLKQAADLIRLLQSHFWTALYQPFPLIGHEVRVSAKLGIAMFPDDGDDGDTLFRNAEVALKKAKAAGERYTFYKPQMSAAIKGKLSLDTELRRALEQQEFVLHYQPKIDLRSGSICGAEALLRWNSPQRGMVLPTVFVPQLEETGLVLEAGRWVIEQAARDRRRWRLDARTAPRVAVNVSQVQLRDANFVADAIRAALAGSGGEAPGLDLEVTESMLMIDVEANIEKLMRLREFGMDIAVDDFGTGYSSLNYLARLPINAVKIDSSFIVSMSDNNDQMNIVSAIISLAHSMNLKTIAEGVETVEQLKILRLIKCDEIQGWLYSKALPSDQFEALLIEARKL